MTSFEGTFFLAIFPFEHYREHYREHFREHPLRRVLLKTERKPATTTTTKRSPSWGSHKGDRDDDDGEAVGGGGRRLRDDPRGDRADLHHDGLQEQVLC